MSSKKSTPKQEEPLSVLGMDSFSPDEPLDSVVSALEKNRYQVVMHNMDWIRQQRDISQNRMCNTDLQGYPTPSRMSEFRTQAKDIPYHLIIRMAAAYGYTPEELAGQLLDLAKAGAPPLSRPEKEYQKYVGTYYAAYFNTDPELGNNCREPHRSLCYGVISVYWRTPTEREGIPVIALFNVSYESCMKLVDQLKKVSKKDPLSVYKQMVSCLGKEKGHSFLRCIYEGNLSLNAQTAELTLWQRHGNDALHLRLHNRAANSSEGKNYKGGLAVMLSNSRGKEHMPCAQVGLLSRRGFSHVTQEELAKWLLFRPPKVNVKKEVDTIVDYMKALFFSDEKNSFFASISEEDKVYMLNSFVEKKVADAIRQNVMEYFKVSTDMDAAVYKALC